MADDDWQHAKKLSHESVLEKLINTINEANTPIPMPREEENENLHQAIIRSDTDAIKKFLEAGVEVTDEDIILSTRTFSPQVIDPLISVPGTIIPLKAIRMMMEFFVKADGDLNDSKLIQKMVSLKTDKPMGMRDKIASDKTGDEGIIQAVKTKLEKQ